MYLLGVIKFNEHLDNHIISFCAIMSAVNRSNRLTITVLLIFAFIIIVALGPVAIITSLLAVETKAVQVSGSHSDENGL